jgi:hypothetical protein
LDKEELLNIHTSNELLNRAIKHGLWKDKKDSSGILKFSNKGNHSVGREFGGTAEKSGDYRMSIGGNERQNRSIERKFCRAGRHVNKSPSEHYTEESSSSISAVEEEVQQKKPASSKPIFKRKRCSSRTISNVSAVKKLIKPTAPIISNDLNFNRRKLIERKESSTV